MKETKERIRRFMKSNVDTELLRLILMAELAHSYVGLSHEEQHKICDKLIECLVGG